MENFKESKTRERLEDIAEELDAYLRYFVKRKFDSFLVKPIVYSTLGDKKLIGSLLILIGELLGGNRDELLDIASAMELACSASLIQGDIINGLKIRNDKETVWAKYGVDVALLLSHIMVSAGVLIITRKGDWLAKFVIDAWRRASIGNYLDILYKKEKLEWSVCYDEIIGLKTGSLFEAACFVGAGVVAGIDAARAAGVYGYNIGCAYQVIDDLAGLSADKEEGGSTKLLELEGRGDAWDYGFKLAQLYLEQATFAVDSLSGFTGRDVEILKYVPTILVKDLAKKGGRRFEDVINSLLQNIVSKSQGSL